MADQNLQKFENQNPIQRYFLGKFFSRIETIYSSLPSITRVADIGCGEGFTIRRLQTIHTNVRFTGVDPDRAALDYAKKFDTTSQYIEGSVFSLPFPDSHFDLVLCNEVLEHLEHPYKALNELSRISKKYILLSVPHEPFFRLSNLLRGRNIMRCGNYPFHLQTWSKRSFVNFIETVCHVENTWTPFPWTVVLARVRHE